MTALTSSLLAASLYLGGTLYQMHCLGKRLAVNANLLRGIGVFALLAHAVSLYLQLITDQGLSLGFFNAASLIAWLIIALTLLSSLRAPVTSLLLGLYPLALITGVLAWLFPNHGTTLVAGQSGLLVHVLLSILAYGILTIAAFQAILLAIQEYQLKHKHPTRFIRTFPPLQTMERLLFQFLLCGEILLTLALLSGFMFLDNMLAQGIAHKTLLSCLAWVVFGILLWGRHFRGWRGSYAIRWTLAGFLLLMLAYFGSKLVREFLLPL
ncbi:inner membrane protein YpjD [Halopseudomonas phragmitis]|uniref:Inner membrane protein YpjD n=2 Tax=Pseudomonadaceae TaxID=135621 RepID=A0A1V0B0I1_9GAMM|nr:MULTISPECIES: cytochrome c biogenesis protein CcsA [Pseudomonadaceae]AQZ93391.1 inner membrane protein YpjD [Halopseudomonas phragmitis]PAU89747.1 inner membrane protein YpjD [Pseudomonas sp. WN033]RHW19881.1 inner membrane protein YpjD [Pseudomonas jilinensis]